VDHPQSRGSPRAWASAPCSGDCTRSQPTLPASIEHGSCTGNIVRASSALRYFVLVFIFRVNSVNHGTRKVINRIGPGPVLV